MKPSLQYIVGDCQERGRNFDAQRFCGFQIDDECELGRLFDREGNCNCLELIFA